MMNEFILEIYGEEIPSWAQRFAEKDLKDLIEEFLILKKVQYSKFQIKGKVKAESFAQKSWFYYKTKGVNISSSNLRNSL